MNKQKCSALFDRIKRFASSISSLEIPVYSANACYFLVLAVFPTLLLLLSIMRFTKYGPENLVSLLDRIVPAALMPFAERLIISVYSNASGALVSLAAITALWSASRGMYGVLVGLNAVYGVKETRGYWFTRGISMVYTFFFIVTILLTLVIHVFGTTIIHLFSSSENPFLVFLSNIVDARFVLLLILQTCIFTAIFTVLPNRKMRLWENLPGGILASLGWLIFSDLFSFYMENFNRYSNIYGSIYTVALAMLWLYFCISIVFYGGVFNKFLIDRKPHTNNV